MDQGRKAGWRTPGRMILHTYYFHFRCRNMSALCSFRIKVEGGDQSSAKKVWLIVCKVWSCIRVTGHCNSNNSIAKKEQKEHLTCMGILNIHQNSKKIDHSQRDPLQTPPAIHKVSELWVVCAHPTNPEDLNGFIRFSRSQRDLN